jgi:flagellin FlaB
VKNRRGLTGLETAIILVAFVITSTAFAYVVMNMGFITAEQAQNVIGGSMEEASSALQLDSDIIGTFANHTDEAAYICLTKAVFYVTLGPGGSAIDMDDDQIVITYSNPRCHGVVYDGNTNVTAVTVITGDADTILEPGERFKIAIDFTAIDGSNMDPAQGSMTDVYTHPYEEITIEVQPSQGGKMTINRRIPQVTNAVMGF